MTIYQECSITSQTIEEAFYVCLENNNLSAGICCSSVRQIRELSEIVIQIKDGLPPWGIERIATSKYAITVRFSNGSNLYFFLGTERGVRGRLLHYLRVDEYVNEYAKEYILNHSMREYDYQENNSNISIFEFAEQQLNAPLLDWQKEMLVSLANGGIYIAGRNYAKQKMIDIYKDWTLAKLEGECCECEYTYDEIMAGISAK